MKPKALFAEAVQASHTSILVGDLAKLISQNGVNIGSHRLFEWLRQNGFLIKRGSSRNMPTQYSMDLGLFEVKERAFTNPDGSVRVTRTTKVTGKGQVYFINKFLEKSA
jgi:anti-repressor protein